MNIINESQSEFHQKIGSYLEQCAPNPDNVDVNEFVKLLPISLRERVLSGRLRSMKIA